VGRSWECCETNTDRTAAAETSQQFCKDLRHKTLYVTKSEPRTERKDTVYKIT